VRKEKELREMIYPHLRMQNQCEKKNCEQECACQEVPSDLIVLDEEQEDEDDLDV
jgi:hypothetical protein